MKIWKPLLLIVTLAFATGAIAQTAGPGGQLPTQHFRGQRKANPQAEFFRNLHLAKPEQKSVLAFFKQQAQARKAFMKANKGDRAAMRQYQMQNVQKTETFMQTTLSPDQFTKFQTFEQEIKMPQLQADQAALRHLKLDKPTRKTVQGLKVGLRNQVGMFIADHVGDEAAIQGEFKKDWVNYETQLQKTLSGTQWQAYSASFHPGNP